ncbi:UV-stimulated scaffold protein A [Esox lucius]|uniref:UV-stimulated scaffold protein A n=1 Tax=Esox lucius TaxID=8010 RepID=A0AAY5KY16_ESOLU|nr:UV-stimulated scaffold protein A [Esox lucius]XP_010897000.2 UV-stimulated scaffold protein A [Esox lucius]
MDHAQRDKLSELVEDLTTSGEPQLNPNKLTEVKKICKVSIDYIEHFYHLIMTQLAKEHAEIRLSAFQMVSELFTRSHHFRVLLVDNFQEFLDLTVETDSDEPLPPPKEVARKLKTIAIQTVQEWQAKYGEAYKKLALGYHFLKQVKKVDFHDVQARTLAERKRQEEKKKRLDRIYKEKVEKAAKEMEDAKEEIEQCLTEINNSMKLLLPTEFEFGDLHTPTTPNHSIASFTSLPNGKSSTSSDMDDQPCCSKDLGDESKNGHTETSIRTTADEVEDCSEEDDDDDMEGLVDEDAFIRNTGLISHKYSLDLNLSTDLKLKETEENEAVVNIIKDLHKLISTKYLPSVQSWVQVFTKAGVPEPTLRQAIDLKKSLDRAMKKHEELHIDYKARQRRVMKAPEGSDDDDDDDDFEEVPEKEGFEPHIPDHLRVEYGLDASSSNPLAGKESVQPPVRRHAPSACHILSRPRNGATDEEQDPTCAASTLRLFKQRLPQATASSSGHVTTSGGCLGPTDQANDPSEDRKNAPVIPFGLDLYYWGKEQPTAGKIIKNSSQHQFWVPIEVEEEVENKELAAQMKSRYITFAGRFEPVKHRCKAPMPSGALCERQDRVKCPFHGRIVPRDNLGKPTNPEDAERLEKEEWKRREEQPDWRDPELMRDIELATGEDLGSSKTFGKHKKGKGKRKKYPNLSDLKKSANTSRSRLEKKVFNPSSMRRVTDVMNKMDKLKHAKFANQFNYALN